jgi:hypothetical protein
MRSLVIHMHSAVAGGDNYISAAATKCEDSPTADKPSGQMKTVEKEKAESKQPTKKNEARSTFAFATIGWLRYPAAAAAAAVAKLLLLLLQQQTQTN